MTAIRLLALIGSAVAVCFLATAAIAFAYAENDFGVRTIIHAVIGAAVSGGVLIALWGRRFVASPLTGLATVAVVWSVLPLLVGISLSDLAKVSVSNGVFEAVSGLSTTGATAFVQLDGLPRALVFHRALLHWIGGYLALLTVLLVLAPLGIGGLASQAVARARGGRGAFDGTRPVDLARTVALAYATTTLVAGLSFMIAGAGAFDALCLAMTGVSSGGFLPFDDDLKSRVGSWGLFIFAVVLTIAATSVFWHRMVFRWQISRLREHRESYAVIGLVLLLTLVLFASVDRLSAPGADVGRGLLLESLFNAASLVSTSGIESRPGIMTLIAMPVVLFVMLVGGSAYSTSGGMKLYRVGAMLVQSGQELHRLVYPSGVLPKRFGSQPFDLELMKAVWAFFVTSIVTVAVGSIALAPWMPSFEAAFIASVAAFSGAGPLYEAGWQQPGTAPWPRWAELADPAKWVAIVMMTLGRIEVLGIIALVSLRLWRTRN